MKQGLKRMVFLVLSAAMILSLLLTTVMAASADDPEDQVAGGVNGYMAALTADKDTSSGYKTAFTTSDITIDSAGHSETLNGKVWADKTVVVSADANNNKTGAFDVTLSALGQTSSSSTATTVSVGYDVVFVLDFSGSMNYGMDSSSDSNATVGSTRADAMVDALNVAMTSLMANEHNRVGVITFSGSDISGNTFLPLDHYTTSGTTSISDETYNEYFDYIGGNTRYVALSGVDYSNNAPNTANINVADSSGNTPSTTYVSVTGGTPTQGGIYAAQGMLTSAAGSTEQNVIRVPMIVLLTDGAAGRADSNYTAPDNVIFSGSAASGGYADGAVAAYTILTANSVKANVTAAYNNVYGSLYEQYGIDAGSVGKIYTIGVAIDTGSWVHYMLEPGMDTEGLSSDSILTINGTNISSKEIITTNGVYATVTTNGPNSTTTNYYGAAYYLTGSVYAGGYTNNFNYVTQYYASDDVATLIDAFQDITGDVTNVDTSFGNATETTGGRDKMTFVDTLGEGITLGGDASMKLAVPTEDGERVYTLEPHTYDSTTGEYTEITEDGFDSVLKDPLKYIYYRPTSVTDENGTTASLPTGLPSENVYDKAALDDLVVTLNIPASTGRLQIQAAIPPALMAYNVLASTTNGSGTTYTYTESDPIRISYVAEAAADTEAGGYYAGALGRTYLTFAPSSTQNAAGEYLNPYYWETWAGLGSDTLDKDGTAVEGSETYVYKTDVNANKMVYIYLGNNGKLALAGKDLAFTIHWDDAGNVDNVRPESMGVQLYAEYVESVDAALDTVNFNPDSLTELTGENYKATLNVSNIPADNTNEWQYIFPNLPTYKTYTDGNGDVQAGYIRYWLVFDAEDVAAAKADGYSSGLWGELDETAANPNGTAVETGGRTWFCFTVDAGEGLTDDGELDVILMRERDTVGYTITKEWNAADFTEDTIPDKITIQMYANGQPVDENGNSVEAGEGLITLYKSVPGDDTKPAYAAAAWTAALELPKNSAGGNAIQYTPVEVDEDDAYTVTTKYTNGSTATETKYTATLTNYKSVDKTSLTVTKIWEDNDNQDNVRPGSVTFKLAATVPDTTAAGGTKALTDEELAVLTGLDSLAKTLDNQDDGTGGSSVTWEDLPKTYTAADGAGPVAVIYSAAEMDGNKAVAGGDETGAGYTVTYDDATASGYLFVTNSYKPVTADITISKVWEDAGNQDGIRPANNAFSGRLWQKVGEDGAIGVVRSWASTTGGDVTITGLPLNDKGETITYYVSETAIGNDGAYTLTVNGGAADGESITYGNDTITVYPVDIEGGIGAIALTNTHKAATTDYTVTLNWVDTDPSLRPDTINLTLAQTVEDGDDNTNSSYAITLELSDGTVTNASWGNNASVPGTLAVNEDGTLSISGLAQYSSGTLITYSVGVTGNKAGDYTATLDNYTMNSDEFTLAYAPETVNLVLAKEWNNYPDEYKGTLSAEALGLELYADGVKVEGVTPAATLSGNNWVFTWSGLLKNDSSTGDVIEYTVKETAQGKPNTDGSKTEGTFTANPAGSNTYTATLANTFDPTSEANQMAVTVTKAWNDYSDANKLRPGTDDGTAKSMITLYNSTDGNKTSVGTPAIKDNGGDTWTYTWEGVPKYDADGKLIPYVVEETNVPEGYSVTNGTITVTSYDTEGNGVATESIINNLNADAYTSGYLTITKAWADQDDKDGSRPGTVTFDIRGLKPEEVDATSTSTTASSTLIEVALTDGQWTAENKTNSTIKPDVAQDGNGGFSFTIALPANSQVDGGQLTYYVIEAVPDGYTATYTGTAGEDVSSDSRVPLSTDEGYPTVITVTNTHTPNTCTVSYDANGGDGDVPTGASGLVSGSTVTVAEKPDGLAKDGCTFLGWSTTAYPAISTTADAELVNLVDGTITVTSDVTLYAAWAIDTNGNNEPDYNEQSINLTFIWEDGNNRDGLRPDSVTVTLTDGGPFTAMLTGKDGQPGNVVLKDSNTWVSTYLGDVTVSSVESVDGYTAESDGTTVTLAHSPATMAVTAAKSWVNMNEAPSTWSDITATLALYANGVPYTSDSSEVTAAVKYEGNSGPKSVEWKDLYVNEKGAPINYTIVETAITATVNDEEGKDIADHFRTAIEGTEVTNTLLTLTGEASTRDFTFIQGWNDGNNAAGMRPDSITVQLAADDGSVEVEPVTLTAKENWAYTWNDLQAFKTGTDTGNLGKDDYITYTVENVTMNFTGNDGKWSALYTNGQAMSTSAMAMWTASLDADAKDYYRTITVTKAWDDSGNQLGLRPNSVMILLNAGGKTVQTATLDGSGDPGWTATFNVPKYQNFEEIAYTVGEFGIPSGYTVSYSTDGGAVGDSNEVTVTNIYETSSSYQVAYDGNGGTGAVPEDNTGYNEFNTTATVLGNTGGLSRENAIFLGWSTTKYPVITTSAEKALVTILNAGDKITVTAKTTLYAVWAADTNSNVIPDYNEETVNLAFTWVDENDKDGLRPAELTVTLADGKELAVGLGSVTVSGNVWTTVAGYLSGTEIQSVTAPDGYTAEVGADKTSVILTHTPGTVAFTLAKSWENMDKIPAGWESVTAAFVLYGNGKPVIDDSPKTAAYNKEGNTVTVTWTGLAKYEDGVAITYHAYETGVTATVEETAGTDATSTVDGTVNPVDVGNYFRVAYGLDGVSDGYDGKVTNAFLVNAGKQQRAFTFVLSWDDNNDGAGNRPGSLEVQLIDQDNKEIGDPVTINADNGWTYTWYNLDVYQSDGTTAVEYTVSYEKPEKYTGSGSEKFSTNGGYVNTQIDTLTDLIPVHYVGCNPSENEIATRNVAYGGSAPTDVPVSYAGYTFLGWYSEAANGTKYNDEPVEKEITLYAHWRKNSSGGHTGSTSNGSSPGGATPELNLEDHVAYIVGYEDGTVQPANEITRAEVATIFFRLLTDGSRDSNWLQSNSYSDVDTGNWFNNAVSTLSNAGIITGYEDGTFQPNEPITRAEFATIAARFSDVVYTGDDSFSDVPGTYWAARYIALAEYLGWINGYDDGTFRPAQNITRAEAVTMINRVLERAVEEDDMLPDMVTWSDNTPDAWYYEAVQEATNSHGYSRTLIQVPGRDFYYESWENLLTVPDWVALEKSWSTANSK